jgi:peroxin-16
LLQRYKTFVRRNRALLTAIEQGAAGLTWLVPDGAHTEIIAEAASSFVGVVATLNDHFVGDEDELRRAESEEVFEDALEDVEEDASVEDPDATRTARSRFVDDTADTSKREVHEDAASETRASRDDGDVPSTSERLDARDRTARSGFSLRAIAASLKKADERACAFLEAVPVPLCLGVLSQVEVLSEMIAKRRAEARRAASKTESPEEDALGAVVVLETARACLKLALWSRQKGKLLVDDGLSPYQLGDEDEDADADAGGGGEGTSSASALGVSNAPPGERRAALALDALYQFRMRARARRVARERAERARRDLEEGETGDWDPETRATASDDERSREREREREREVCPELPPPPLPPPPGLTLRDALREDRARLALKLVGEVCHIARPLAYASSMKKHGRKSWRPLLVSASLDVTMFACLNAAGGADESRFSSSEKMEARRRRKSTWFYLMRSPVFERFTEPALKATGSVVNPIPLIGGLYGKAVAIAKDVNEHFAYTY